jgi:hypothetical protein
MISPDGHPEPGHIIRHSGPDIKSFFIDPDAQSEFEHVLGGLYGAFFLLSTALRLRRPGRRRGSPFDSDPCFLV